MAVAQGILTARGGATSHAAVVARQIGKPCVAGCARARRRLRRQKSATANGVTFARRRLDQRRRLDRRGLRRRAADGLARASRISPSSSRSSAGRTRSAGWRSGRTPTSPRRPPRPAATVPRASACAGRSTCSARAIGSRSSASAILVANVATRAKAKHARREPLSVDETEARRDVRRGDGEARGPPAGRLRGHLQGHGRPAGRRPADRPAAPRVPAEPRGAARQGDQGRATTRPPRTANCSRPSSRCTSRTRCSACAAAGSA